MPSKPKLGQNFLVDAQAAARIVSALGELSDRTVVEIGPGRGAITGLLAGRARHVIAVELDRELAAQLRARFTPEQVTVVEQDVLGFDFAAAAARAGHPLPVVGNLPYYITSPILLKLAASHTALDWAVPDPAVSDPAVPDPAVSDSAVLDSAVLMVQREVAARLTAAPGTRDYGSLSVMTQMHGPVEELFTLPPASFSPPPEVHSTVFRWRFAPRFAELGVEAEAFLRFVRQAFAQKRKTLQNNLRAAGFAPPAAALAMAQAGIEGQARAEAVAIPALAALWRSLHCAQAPPPDSA
jgi:16S rRNA (adenine1518-N6/adenine1519-N6)-dimethyltransferase